MTPFERVIIDRLSIIDRKLDNFLERIVLLEERTSRKAGIYGALAGLLPALVIVAYWLLQG